MRLFHHSRSLDFSLKKIEIYTGWFCPYCSRAKSLLKKKKVKFIEYTISLKPSLRKEMNERSGGLTSVPQIFINDAHIGGCDDLYELERLGKLDELL